MQKNELPQLLFNAGFKWFKPTPQHFFYLFIYSLGGMHSATGSPRARANETRISSYCKPLNQLLQLRSLCTHTIYSPLLQVVNHIIHFAQ